MRSKKLTADSEIVKDPTPEFLAEWRRKAVEVLVDAEARRRRQAQGRMREEGREKQREEDEIEARKRKRDQEKEWEESREGRIGSWRDWQKGVKRRESSVNGNMGPGEGVAKAEKKKKKLKVLG